MSSESNQPSQATPIAPEGATPTMAPQVASVLPDATLEHKPLYHYSGTGGFLGMLKTNTIWFTHIQFMNDSEEYSYAIELLHEVLGEYRGMEIRYLESRIEEAFGVIPQVYTFSLSTARDLLSQWRAYSPEGGYSFAFSEEQLKLLLDTPDPHLELHKCIYDREEQKEFIRKKILAFPPEGYALGGEHAPLSIANNFVANYKLLPVIKHPSFKEEEEWRIIAHYKGQHNLDYEKHLRYREGRGMMIPYLEIAIPPMLTPALGTPGIGFAEVLIGPTPHKELAKTACELLLLNRHKCRKEDINSSAIPYRNW